MFTDENTGGKLAYSRNARIGFLVLAIIQVFSRTLYLLSWAKMHYNDEDCASPSATSGDDPVWLSVFGTFPVGFFLSAFSINISTFAKIFHKVSHQHIARYKILTAFLVSVNILVYLALILFFTGTSGAFSDFLTSYGLLLFIIIGELTIGLFLFSYSLVLYYSYPFQMKRLFIVCTATFLCMVTKTALMLILQYYFDGNYNLWIFPLYFIIGEIIPFFLMYNIDFIGSSNQLDFAQSFTETETEEQQQMKSTTGFSRKSGKSGSLSDDDEHIGSLNET